MILTEKIVINKRKNDIEYYISKGYDCSGKTIDINTSDLKHGSNVKILVKCEICGKESVLSYNKYIVNKNRRGYYGCRECSKFKRDKTCLEKYGEEHPIKLIEFKNKRENNNVEKYGFKNTLEIKEIRDQIKSTNIKKYGFDNPQKNKTIQDKTKKTCLNRYGSNSPLGNDEIQNKIKKTNIEKYGCDHIFSSNIIKDKINQTNIEKYGFDSASKNSIIKDKISKKHINNYINKMSDKIPLKMLDNNNYKSTCEKGHSFEIQSYQLRNRLRYDTIVCPICNPVNSYSESGYEIQLKNFIENNYKSQILLNNRNIIGNQELDIYLPDLKLAFEFDGLYWHSELYKEKNYHQKKTEDCEKENIKLIHIYEDDWIYKQNIVKSRILNLLDKSEKIYARKCEIKETDDNEIIREFLEQNHLQGFVGSKIKIGLFYNKELLSLMTFGNLRKPMGQKSNEGSYEMLRFCNKLNTNVIGGASRLFKYFVEQYKPKEVISYADRSWSTGNLYEKLGFELIHKTEPNYYYIIDGIRKHRFNYRKDKLIKDGADPTKTEHEIMLDKKIYRIYDSGHIKFRIKY